MKEWRIRWARLTRWEFWTWYIFYLPVMAYYLLLALRHRSFFYFTASNPCMDMGGMMGTRKSSIYACIPQNYYPKTQLVEHPSGEQLAEIAQNMGYPLIVKPNVGERGRGVALVHRWEELRGYAEKNREPFLLQAYVDYPVEVGVFYVRHPDQPKGRVTSLVLKKFLTVSGDGHSTIAELLSNEVRAASLDLSEERFSKIINQVLPAGERLMVEPIGNHCRGTTFLNGCHLIDEQLEQTIDDVAQQIESFYYGRFDIRCASIEELKAGRQFQIIELNGANAEPAHIYQPGLSLWRAYQVMFWHYRQMAIISYKNKKRGFAYPSFRAGIKKISDIRAYHRHYAPQ